MRAFVVENRSLKNGLCVVRLVVPVLVLPPPAMGDDGRFVVDVMEIGFRDEALEGVCELLSLTCLGALMATCFS